MGNYLRISLQVFSLKVSDICYLSCLFVVLGCFHRMVLFLFPNRRSEPAFAAGLPGFQT